MGGFTAAASSNVVTSLFVASPGSAGFVQVEAGSSFAGMLTLNAAPSVDTTITLTVSDLPILSIPSAVVVPAFSAVVPMLVTGVAPGEVFITAAVGSVSTNFQYCVHAAGGAVDVQDSSFRPRSSSPRAQAPRSLAFSRTPRARTPSPPLRMETR